jgi:hypothetical protein
VSVQVCFSSSYLRISSVGAKPPLSPSFDPHSLLSDFRSVQVGRPVGLNPVAPNSLGATIKCKQFHAKAYSSRGADIVMQSCGSWGAFTRPVSVYQELTVGI